MTKPLSPITRGRRGVALASLVLAAGFVLAAPAMAQDSPPGAAPGEEPPPEAPEPPEAPAAPEPPSAAPPVAPASPPPPVAPAAGAPAPAETAPGEPPPPQDPNLPALDYSAPPPPPPPPERPGGGFEMPPWSARVDPFNWLLEGRLGLELEVGVLDFLSVEVVPVFVVNDKPPTLNFRGSADVFQKSNGLGPVSGATVDLGFWLDGRAFRGYVIRVGMTNFGYEYETKDDAGVIDSVQVTERVAFAMFGSASRWGAFTISGGIGLGMHLKKQERCFPEGASSVAQATTNKCDQQLLIARDRGASDLVDLNGALFPVDLMGRFSLGVTFD
jgi:hypothetical protein